MIEVDFAQKGSKDFMLIVDTLTGYLQAFEVKNKSTSEAVRCLREWSSLFGKPYRCKSDFGPGVPRDIRKGVKTVGDRSCLFLSLQPKFKCSCGTQCEDFKRLT